MPYRFSLVSLLVLALSPVLPAGAQDGGQPRYFPTTASGLAYPVVTTSIRSGETMTVAVEFRTDDPAYPGETLYENIPDDEVVRRVYLEAGDRNFELLRQDGTPMMPPELHLVPNPDGQAGALVGEWEGVFEAPHHDLREITLFLPNVDPIGRFPIRNR